MNGPDERRAPTAQNDARSADPGEAEAQAGAGRFPELARLGQISHVLARHGFASLLARAGLRVGDHGPDAPDGLRALARRFRSVLEDLGPTFVKVGQILSTRGDLLPAEFVEELALLQDGHAPLPIDVIRDVIEAELGGTIEELFKSFDWTPLGSASIAQVHAARLARGTRVVVKVQRPDIAATIRGDLGVLHALARLLELTIEEMDLVAPTDIVAAMNQALTSELDFGAEAANLERFRANFSGSTSVYAPALYAEQSGQTVLTMEQISGRHISDLEPESDEAFALAERLIEGFYEQVFHHGFVHGDPHPGNLIALDDGRIAFIDFGLCATLSAKQRDELLAVLLNIATDDMEGLARALCRASDEARGAGGSAGRGRSRSPGTARALAAALGELRASHLQAQLSELNAAAFMHDALQTARRFRLTIPSAYALLAKAAMTLEGVIRQLIPTRDLSELGRSYASRLVRERLTPGRISEDVLHQLASLHSFVRDVPPQLEQLLMDATDGGLAVEVKNPALQELGPLLNEVATRLTLGVLSAGALVATPLVFAVEPWWIATGSIPAATVLMGAIALSFGGSALLWRGDTPGVDRRLRLETVRRVLRRLLL